MDQDKIHVVTLFGFSGKFACDQHTTKKTKIKSHKKIFFLSQPDDRYCCYKCNKFMSKQYPRTLITDLFGEVNF